MRKIFCLVLFCVFYAAMLRAQPSRPFLERLISVDYAGLHIDAALKDIERKGGFYFAYNTSLIDASKTVTLKMNNVPVRRVLDKIFEGTMLYVQKDEYVILRAAPAPVVVTAEPPKKISYTISGYCLDEKTGAGVPRVSLYDSLTLISAVTDAYGHFTMELPGATRPLRLHVSRVLYRDTVLMLAPSSNRSIDVRIAPLVVEAYTPKDSVALLPPTVFDERHSVERFKLIDPLISLNQRVQALNIGRFIPRNAQVSLVPLVSTNGTMGGSVMNRFSLNVIAGYSGGTNGVELGGVLNVDRGDVRWLQLGGVGNMVGGKTSGLQGAGVFNINLGSLYGVQLAGTANVILDTLYGVQGSGVINIIHGGIRGLQLAGTANLVTRDMEGGQLAGVVNFTLGRVSKAQAAGVMNYARSVEGIQAAGVMNVALHRTQGIQVAGMLNASGSCSGEQVSGMMNFVGDSLQGGQVSALLNIAPKMVGSQIAVMNIAGRMSGMQVGLFNYADTCSRGSIIGLCSIVRKGYHQIEIASTEKLFLNVSVRTGLRKFYNIFLAGKDPNGQAWSFGYGFGNEFLFRPKFGMNIEFTVQHLNPGGFAKDNSDWGKLPLLLTWKPVRGIALAAGPVLNAYYTSAPVDSFTALKAHPFYDRTFFDQSRLRGWVGASFALRFF